MKQRYGGTWHRVDGQSIEGTGKDNPSTEQHPGEAGHRLYG